MEVNGQIPEWNNCHLSKQPETVSGMNLYREKVRVFPREFPFQGISFEQWEAYSTGEDVPCLDMTSDGSDSEEYIPSEEEEDTIG